MVQSATPLILPTGEHANEGKDVAPATAPLPAQSWEDQRLTEEVENALRATGYGALRTVRVSVSAGVVILAGRVASYYLKQVVHETALAIPGARQIHNGLNVVRRKSDRQNA